MDGLFFLWLKEPQPIKKIGYIRGNDLIPFEDNWNIRRIPIKCENCAENDYYELKLSYKKVKFMAFIPSGTCDHTYYITCPKCSRFKLVLEDKEYIELKNKKLIIDKIHEESQSNQYYSTYS